MQPFSAKAPAPGALLALFLFAVPLAVAWQSPQTFRERNSNVAAGQSLFSSPGEGSPAVEPAAARTVALENEIALRLEVQRLYALSSELKDDVNATDSRVQLNTAVLKRAQEIEKLARQIRDRARR